MHNEFEHLMMHRERENDIARRRRPTGRRARINNGGGSIRVLTREIRLRYSSVLEALGTRAINRAKEIRRRETIPA